MTAVPDSGIASDAELVAAAAGGDRGAFGAIYDRYANRLFDFCVGMMRDSDAAADCVQEAYCTAANRLADLRDADKLRPAVRHCPQRGAAHDPAPRSGTRHRPAGRISIRGARAGNPRGAYRMADLVTRPPADSPSATALSST